MSYAEVDFSPTENGIRGKVTDNTDNVLTSLDQRVKSEVVRNSVVFADCPTTYSEVSSKPADPSALYADVEEMRKRKMTSSNSSDTFDDYDNIMTKQDLVRLQSVSSRNNNQLLQRRLHGKKDTIDDDNNFQLKR